MCRTRRLLSLLFLLAILFTQRPGRAQLHIYWGDVHGHTKHSDGKGTLDDYFRYARDVSRLDFAIVSDHDFGNSAPWRMPVETWRLTQSKADEYTRDGKFVAIAGYEWTSQAKYWSGVKEGDITERLFPGPPKLYNHKVVYLPQPIPYLFSAKDAAYKDPDSLAEAVRRNHGLIHNAHPTAGPEGRDQWAYSPRNYDVITNTEMDTNTLHYQGKTYQLDWEKTVCSFLNQGGKTGFVKGTDSHEGKPAARTAVLAPVLTRAAIFDALRHRHNYAVTNAKIELDFRIDGHVMGDEVTCTENPHFVIAVRGTDRLSEVAIVRDGATLCRRAPETSHVQFDFTDDTFKGNSYYYLRVVQVDQDKNGNPSRAWSSPIWVTQVTEPK